MAVTCPPWGYAAGGLIGYLQGRLKLGSVAETEVGVVPGCSLSWGCSPTRTTIYYLGTTCRCRQDRSSSVGLLSLRTRALVRTGRGHYADYTVAPIGTPRPTQYQKGSLSTRTRRELRSRAKKKRSGFVKKNCCTIIGPRGAEGKVKWGTF